MTPCIKCNDTYQRQCTPDCPFVEKTPVGRGWQCDVDARLEYGCPPCECMGLVGVLMMGPGTKSYNGKAKETKE